MNTNIIKGLRNILLSTVSAAAMTIGFTACSDKEYMTDTADLKSHSYNFSISANFGKSDTRAVDYNSQTGGYDATFELGDFIFVYNLTQDGMGMDEQRSLRALHPETEGKSAILSGSLAFVKETSPHSGSFEPVTPQVGDRLLLCYKDMYPYYTNQNGIYLNNNDFAEAEVTILKIDGENIVTTPAVFKNSQSIYKFTFLGLDEGVTIKALTVHSEQNKLKYHSEPKNKDFNSDIMINCSNDITNVITAMLRFDRNPGDNISFTVAGSDDYLYTSSKAVPTDGLENGKYYDVNISLTKTDRKVFKFLKGETPLALDTYYTVYSNESEYTMENYASDIYVRWLGGDKAMTFNNVYLEKFGNSPLIDVSHDNEHNSPQHKLVLEGDNIINGQSPEILISDGNTLSISGTGKLTIAKGIYLGTSSVLSIESGEVIVDGSIFGQSPKIVLTGRMEDDNLISGKLSIKNVTPGPSIEAGSGYMLNTATEGGYTVYTITEAPTEITYVEKAWNETNVTSTNASIGISDCNFVTAPQTQYGPIVWEAGTYVVNNDLNVNDICLKGDVNLILCDGKTLTASGQIYKDNEATSCSLTIYGQTGNSGKLVINSSSGPAINQVAKLTIHGGDIEANSSGYCAAINDIPIDILGGSLKAMNTGEAYGGGISSSNINVYDGELTAIGHNKSDNEWASVKYGISVTGQLIIYGGKVAAQSIGGNSYPGNAVTGTITKVNNAIALQHSDNGNTWDDLTETTTTKKYFKAE